MLLQVRDRKTRSKREPSFVKNHMARDDDATGFEVHATVAAMVGRISKKDASNRSV